MRLVGIDLRDRSRVAHRRRDDDADQNPADQLADESRLAQPHRKLGAGARYEQENQQDV
jgi:hypothetical protein